MTARAATWSELGRHVKGEILVPGEAGYDVARRVWNAAVDRHPALIVRPAGVGDVQTAVSFAAQHALPVSVRGGGHHHAGHAVGDGALMLDLSGLRAVNVNPAARTATVQPGATWAEFDVATTAVGLAVTGADIPVVGVAGTTLGGGLGWLHRLHGLSADNLLSAQLVTADGQARTVSGEEHPELFWALRGGGGGFGVVTSLTFALHPMPEAHFGSLMLPLDRARDGLGAYRELCVEAEDQLFIRAVLLPAVTPFVPESLRGHPVLLAAAHFGSAAAATAALRPLRALGAADPKQISYLGLQRLTQQDFPGRVHAAACGHFLEGLTDGLIDTVIAAAEDAPPLWMIQFESVGGAASRIAPGATAFPHRGATHYLHLQSLTLPQHTSEEYADWVRRTNQRIRPHTTGGIYANVTMGDEDIDLATAAYGANLGRLLALKAETDPDNLFRFTPLTAAR